MYFSVTSIISHCCSLRVDKKFRYSTGMEPKFSDSPDQYWENPVLLLEKSLRRCPSPHFPKDGKWRLPQAVISVKCSFWNNLSLNARETCFPTRLLNDTISWTASNHKTSEDLSTQKTGWSSSLPLLLLQVPPSYQATSAEYHTHLDPTTFHPSKHFTKPDLMWGQLFPWWVKTFSTASIKVPHSILYLNT